MTLNTMIIVPAIVVLFLSETGVVSSREEKSDTFMEECLNQEYQRHATTKQASCNGTILIDIPGKFGKMHYIFFFILRLPA